MKSNCKVKVTEVKAPIPTIRRYTITVELGENDARHMAAWLRYIYRNGKSTLGLIKVMDALEDVGL